MPFTDFLQAIFSNPNPAQAQNPGVGQDLGASLQQASQQAGSTPGGLGGDQLQALALQALQPPPKAPDKSWSDTGREMMKPLAFGLLSSLIHPKLSGPLGGLKQGITAGLGEWQRERDIETQSQLQMQKNRVSAAKTIGSLATAKASEELKKAQMEATSAQRQFTNEYRIGEAAKRDAHNAVTEAASNRREGRLEKSASEESAVRALIREKDLLDIQKGKNEAQVRDSIRGNASKIADQVQKEGNPLLAQMIKENPSVAQKGLDFLQKKATATLNAKASDAGFSLPSGGNQHLTNRQLVDMDSLREKVSGELRQMGLGPQAEAVKEPWAEKFIRPVKENPKDARDAELLAQAAGSMDKLDDIIQGTVRSPESQKELDEFLTGRKSFKDGALVAGGGRPLERQEILLTDTPEQAQKKETQNRLSEAGWVKRFTNYLKYSKNYTEGMDTRIQELLNNVGVVRQQGMAAGMSQTGSRAFKAQAEFFGQHYPSYLDPVSTILEKNRTIGDNFYRSLFNIGRWDLIPKDIFPRIKGEYFKHMDISPGGAISPTPGAIQQAPDSEFQE